MGFWNNRSGRGWRERERKEMMRRRESPILAYVRWSWGEKLIVSFGCWQQPGMCLPIKDTPPTIMAYRTHSRAPSTHHHHYLEMLCKITNIVPLKQTTRKFHFYVPPSIPSQEVKRRRRRRRGIPRRNWSQILIRFLFSQPACYSRNLSPSSSPRVAVRTSWSVHLLFLQSSNKRHNKKRVNNKPN